ncbi:hypothetical protein MRB53_005926 [Persea americana]|uniref:Uncharacterized protein n=1 Tax=Persea americana TaxID=3435 RepID=A0ACC2MF81_PERAE|nr:hypothetical protein MRB53_005926 [Persea americana]
MLAGEERESRFVLQTHQWRKIEFAGARAVGFCYGKARQRFRPRRRSSLQPAARSTGEEEGLRGVKSEFEKVLSKTRAFVVERPGGGSDPGEDHHSNELPDSPEKKRD